MQYWLAWFGQNNDHPKQIAQAAEQMGFTGIALPDHVAIPNDYGAVHPSGRRAIFHDSNYPDALITIATMAAVTTSLRFMTYIYVLPMREPFTAAKQVATLADQSNYRYAFGAGAGWNIDEIQLLGHDPHTRGRRMDEMIHILRDLWDDGVAEFNGEFYKFGSVGEFPVPRQRIPVWIGGNSAAALRRAAHNDGWLGLNAGIEETRATLKKLADERQRFIDAGGRVGDHFQTVILPDDVYSSSIYTELEDLGVNAAVCRVWDTESPNFTSLDSKLDAMKRFADRFLSHKAQRP